MLVGVPTFIGHTTIHRAHDFFSTPATRLESSRTIYGLQITATKQKKMCIDILTS